LSSSQLGDPVARHLPGLVPAERRITIRDLLNHRSGLVNVTDYPEWMATAERSSAGRPLDSVRFAVSQAPAFQAGRSWSYSNTNYLALGLVIEQVSGRSHAEELSARVLEPLGLEHTELATTSRLPDLDDRGTNPNLPWAAGGMVADAQDLARFHSALPSGELLSSAALSAMQQTVRDASRSGGRSRHLRLRLPCGRLGRTWPT
jgi:D-alanyl-D-alanine carboxypeptidase